MLEVWEGCRLCASLSAVDNLIADQMQRGDGKQLKEDIADSGRDCDCRLLVSSIEKIDRSVSCSFDCPLLLSYTPTPLHRKQQYDNKLMIPNRHLFVKISLAPHFVLTVRPGHVRQPIVHGWMRILIDRFSRSPKSYLGCASKHVSHMPESWARMVGAVLRLGQGWSVVRAVCLSAGSRGGRVSS